MKIVNPGNEDFHIHSFNYSDGFNTIDEIVKYAGEIGLTKIAITDHSQATLDKHPLNYAKKLSRKILHRRKNVYNDVEVIFGVECDLLDENGNVCRDIQGEESDFNILSIHKSPYVGDKTKTTQGFENAVKKYHKKINLIGHLCKAKTIEFLDIERIVKIANEYKIPLEFNCCNLVYGKTDLNKEKMMLSLADQVYVNSDAHTLWELKHARQEGFKWLRDNGFI